MNQNNSPALLRLNMHMHSTISDGTRSVAELCEIAKNNKLEYFSITDHDKITANFEARTLAKDYGLNYINGSELSFSIKGSNVHILAYGFDLEKIASIYESRNIINQALMIELIELLKKEGYNLHFNDDTELCRTIIARQLVDKGYFSSMDETYADLLNTEKYSKYVGVSTANSLILKEFKKAGAVLIWAHPFDTIKKNYKEAIEKQEMLKILERLMDIGIDGIEAMYDHYGDDKRKILLEIARSNNLFISAGTDYHAKDTREKQYIDVDSDIVSKYMSWLIIK